ncbi:Xylulose kinase [Pseudoruegeria aquimaris]|uniref:Xylulose kinase n=1 Tax=Pseudoruegeria aquimaris TaxID=393663 RepID=A0A1Y5TD98_9RHOB|nr:xylulokinase [Pseudoruegeria aquimaris]SLN60949.1 Xylulose kinase [Pseudoruegeria aquimaris]
MYLGLDLGTSGLRALLVDASGALIGSAERPCAVAHPHSGWSEQNPAEWIAACEGALAELKARHPKELSALKGIGLSGHMHGATLLDAAGAVLRPCILWNDTRSAAEAAALDATPGFRETSGNIVFPGFTAPKLAWLAKHEPETFAKVAKVLLPKDYLRLWLTGEIAGDMSDCAGTSWLDVGARDWSADLLEKSGMRRDQMPDLVEGSEVAGMLRPALTSDWGISGPCVVVGGGGDNAVAACGVGCFAEGDGFVSLGTSGVVLAAKGSFAPDPASAVHTFCHAIPDTWYQMGVILAATDCMNWLSGNLGKSPAELSGLLGSRIDGPGAVRFLPYLSGERTPHNDSRIRGAFTGLEIATDHAALTQAVMEGVGFALRDNYEALKGTGTDLSRLLAIGGGSRSRYWVELIATLLHIPVDLPEAGDFGAALGAARLAMVGHTGATPADIMTRPKVAETIDPRADLAEAYETAYAQYRALYPALKALNP